MTKVVVELDAFVLPDDHGIFKVSPGKTYRFYQEVKNAKTVFLDIRGLDDFFSAPHEWTDEEMLKAISDDRWQRELLSRARNNEPKGTEGVTKVDTARLGFLKALLGEAKRGDLVVVPADGYDKDVLIGQLLDDPWDVRFVEAPDGDEGVFGYAGRRVSWLASRPKRLFSEGMLKALHTQTAVFRMGASLHEEVYKLAYKSFVYRSNYTSEFHTSKAHFTAEDSAVLSAWLNGYEFLRHSIATGSSSSLPASFEQMGLSKLPDNVASDLSININSPGAFVLKSNTAFALALMAMLPLSACSPQQIIDDGVEIKLKTVGDADPTCAIEVEEEVQTYAQTLAYHRLEKACELGLRAQEDAKVTTKARLK